MLDNKDIKNTIAEKYFNFKSKIYSHKHEEALAGCSREEIEGIYDILNQKIAEECRELTPTEKECFAVLEEALNTKNLAA